MGLVFTLRVSYPALCRIFSNLPHVECDRKGREIMEDRVTLVLDGRLKRAVQEAAHRQGLSMSEYIRRAVHGQLIRDEYASVSLGRECKRDELSRTASPQAEG